MNKDKLLDLALQLGIKKDNFEFGFIRDSVSLENQVILGAKHMGLLRDDEL